MISNYSHKIFTALLIVILVSCAGGTKNDQYVANEKVNLKNFNRSDFIKKSFHAKGRDIPTLAFVKYSDIKSASISTNGTYMAVTYQEADKTKLTILETKTLKPLYKVQYSPNEHIYSFLWVNDQRLLMSVETRTGSLDSEGASIKLYAMNFDGSAKKSLYPRSSMRQGYFSILNRLKEDRKNILIALSESKEGMKVFTMDVYTGRTKLVTKVPTKHGGQYLADKNGVVRLAVAKDEDAKKEDLRNALYLREGKTWRKLNISVNAREESLAPLYVDPKGTFAYVSIGREDQGPSALYHLDLKTNKLKKIASDPISDLVTSRYDYFDEKPYAAVFYPGKQRLVNLDNGSSEMKRMMASLNHISKDPNESVIVTSATQDRSKFIVAFRSDRRPGDYYLFDYKNSKMRYLFSSAPWINPKNMAKMQPVTITARDGLKMQAYLSLPPNAKGPIPFVINIHGGPHGVRDYFGYNPEVQHFTARGYGVLQVNYRGSGGYGSKFLKAGYQKWGQEMQNDLTDSTHWLIKKGYAHPKKICLFGHSYGGYATLMGLVREPDLYACGICSVGVADLNLMIKKGHDGSDRKETKNFFKKVLKTEDQAWLNENSAAMNADRIKAPLFLVHGRNDVRVPFYQFEAMKAAMDKAGKPYEWMVRDEGHGFYKEQNRLDFSVKTIEFLDKHTKTK